MLARLGDLLRISILNWTWSSVDTGQAKSAVFGSYGGLEVALKWIPSCILLFLLFFIPQKVGGVIQNNGDYEPIREKDRYYAKVARNRSEDDPHSAANSLLGRKEYTQTDDDVELSYIPSQPSLNDVVDGNLEYETDHDRYMGLMFRPLRPRNLCFLVPNEHLEVPYESYERRCGDDNDEPYIFVSYTRKAFPVEPKNKGDPDEEQIAAEAREELLRFAVAATKRANAPAFWIDFECVDQLGNSNTANAVSEDVYRICDVLRGAASMAVINGSPWELRNGDQAKSNEKEWLQIWAHRLWVLTELLLAPVERNISVFTRQIFMSPESTCPQQYTKRNLALIACRDALEVRQLIEHYEGNTLLTPLELVQMSLGCLRRRQNNTFDRTGADLAYALKGLLRRRPRRVEEETGFEAFASLSLANDSQKLLERLICTLPPDPSAGWSDMRDGWGVQLWDIEPSCQIAGIVNERTVLLDGAHAACIRWNRLEKVAFTTKDTPFRLFAKFVVRGIPAWLICSVLFIISSVQLLQTPEKESGEGLTAKDSDDCRGNPACETEVFVKRLGDWFHVWAANFSKPFVAFGSIWCLLSLVIVLSSPYLLYRLYHGKFWKTQAWFFGIEGDVEDLADIERRLFGVCKNRLTWSANGSLLSQHYRDPNYDERVAIQPLKWNRKDAVPRHVRLDSDNTLSPKAAESKERLFTLIDTYTLTVTQFFAAHPPTAVFICGQEGGMQRAVLCSYDWKRRTWCRESVLRMKTLVLDKMARVDRFQFALKRKDNSG